MSNYQDILRLSLEEIDKEISQRSALIEQNREKLSDLFIEYIEESIGVLKEIKKYKEEIEKRGG